VSFRIELVGHARVPITAVGLGDAEQQVEKLVRSRCAECRVDVLEVRRLGGVPRIADEYLVVCRLRVVETVLAESRGTAQRNVLLRTRERFVGTALAATIWEIPKLRAGEDPNPGVGSG
jgi:hypothetical protein